MKKFDNLNDFLNYMINDKKIFNLKNLFIFIVVVGIISVGMVYMTGMHEKDILTHDDEHFTDDYKKKVLLEAGYSEEELEQLTEHRFNELFNNIYLDSRNQGAGNMKKEEFPKADSQALKARYYTLASAEDYASIINDFNDKKLEYSFTEIYNKELITIFNDAYYLNTAKNNDSNPVLKLETLKNLRDPQMLLIGTLFAQKEYRNQIFKDKLSLSPAVANRNIRINSVTKTSLQNFSMDKELQKDPRLSEVIRFINEGDYIVYKFDINIDGNNLFAYIYKNQSNSEVDFYGVYAPHGVNNYGYLTVLDWESVDNYTPGDSYSSETQLPDANIETETPIDETNAETIQQ